MKLIKSMTLITCIALLIFAFSGCSGTNKTIDIPSQGTSETIANDPSQADETPIAELDSSFNQLDSPKAGEKTATIETSMGIIKIRLFPQYAPKAVENFIGLAEEGYYDNLKFHRVMEDFMIQGGDPNGDGSGGESIWGGSFGYEFDVNLSHYRGALSMAHSQAPESNGSQFFIVQAPPIDENSIKSAVQNGYTLDKLPAKVLENYMTIGGTPWLDGLYTPPATDGHTVFGQVFEGMDVVDSIAKVEKLPDETGMGESVPKTDVTIKSIKIETV